MKRWKGLYRDHSTDLPASQADSDSALAGQVVQTSSPLIASVASVSPFASNFSDFGDDFTGQPIFQPRSESWLITKDIEALLEEDERRRAKTEELRRETISFDTLSSDSTSGHFVGLPAPPRGPRKVAHRERRGQFRTQTDGSQSVAVSRGAVEKAMDAQRPSTSGSAVPSSTVSPLPSIKDVPIESASSLGTDVMDALNMYTASQQQQGMTSAHTSAFGPNTTQDAQDGQSGVMTSADYRVSGNMASAYPTPSSLRSSSKTRKTTKPQPTRPLLSYGLPSSLDSDFSHSSFSSHDPPSTAHEPRISISSTIYPSSPYDNLPSPIAPIRCLDQSQERRSSLFYSEIDSVTFEDHSGSVVDLSTPTSPEHETRPQQPAIFGAEGRRSSDSFRSDITDNVSSRRRPLSSSDISRRSSSGTKPALPTTPKPDFRRSRSVQPSSKSSMVSKPPSPSSSSKLSGLIPHHLLTSLPRSDANYNDSVPPTTNYLNHQERADLIRKTRKLTQVLGQTPSPIASPGELADSPIMNNCLLPMVPSRRAHPRGVMSVPDTSSSPNTIRGPRDQRLSTITAERTDSLSPITFRNSYSGQGNDSDDSASPFDSPAAQTPMSARKKSDNTSARSPTVISASDSFMEMSDPDFHGLIRFPSTYSLTDSLSDGQKAEEERRRKRERLAKLHRFLGSRVPAELILGPHEMGVPLPALDPNQSDSGYTWSDGESPAKLWIRGRRRNSLAFSDPSHRLPDAERMKEELSEREKAIVVKRALKMERVFGEQPPQDLFHAGHPRTVSRAAEKILKQTKSVPKSAPSSPVSGNINRSAYRKGKQLRRNDSRPSTTESRKALLESNGAAAGESRELETGHDEQSEVYFHYRSSLISLANIVDNDDKQSLAELHEYINEDSSHGHSVDGHDGDSKASIRSDRRRSLPLRASHSSLSSQFNLVEYRAEITPFEVRRRRAAKLSHFFGVSYRSLFGEVLDSIEMGVREDEGKGTLNADEAEDLLAQLTKLKKRRDELS